MKAMVLRGTYDLSENDTPLELLEFPTPKPAEGEVLIRVLACGVCHTDMDEVEGRVVPPSFPIVPGHQVVGVVKEPGLWVRDSNVGDMVGVAWIGGACGKCAYCRNGRENLCRDFIATGRDRDGGFAEFMVADAGFIHPIPEEMDPVKTAPLLCAGAIGYRCVRLSGITDGDTVGLMGFGASAHLVIKLLRHSYPLSEVFVFARGKGKGNSPWNLEHPGRVELKSAPPSNSPLLLTLRPYGNRFCARLRILFPGENCS